MTTSYPEDPRELEPEQEVVDRSGIAWMFVRFDGDRVFLARRRTAQTPESGEWAETSLSEQQWREFVRER